MPNSMSFHSEVLDLRLEILTQGGLVLLLLGSLMGLAVATAPTGLGGFNSTLVIIYILMFALAGACAYLKWTGKPRLALWLCAIGAWSLALLHYLYAQPFGTAIWIVIACSLVTLLLGPLAGWLAVAGAMAGLVAWSSFTTVLNGAALSQAVSVALPAAASTFLTHIMIKAQWRTLRWMISSYETGQQQLEQLQDQRAQLTAALKSLDQTSFALARANEQLQMMVQAAEEARRSKQEFAANISHELRAPLNLVIGFSDMILNEPVAYGLTDLPPALLADLHAVQRNAQHLLKLVNDILDLSQLDATYLTIAHEPVVVSELIRSAVQDIEHLAHLRGLEIQTEIEPALPEVEADRTRMRQVLINLLNNALRFTQHGCLRVFARRERAGTPDNGRPRDRDESTNASSDGDSLVIGVSDTGSGIAPDDLYRIFEPFVQVGASANRKKEGTGLGLTISKRFVELHGGRMWVESEPGVGSTFLFTLPIQPPKPGLPLHSTPHTVHRREVGALAVIERGPVLSRLLDRYLSGITVVQVPDVEQLMMHPQRSVFEAVIQNTPPNPEAQAALARQLSPRLPLLQCYIPMAGPDIFDPAPAPASASGSQPWAGGAPYGICRYLTKPVTREQVYSALADVLVRSCVKMEANNTLNETAITGISPDLVHEPSQRNPGDGRATRVAHVLLIEDDEDTLQMMSRLLRAAPSQARPGFDTVIPMRARSGEQALQILHGQDGVEGQGTNVDGIFLDLMLPGLNGFDVLHALEQDERLVHIPVCVVSGHAISDNPLVTPFLTLSRREGLTVSELTHAFSALLQIALPGVDVALRSPRGMTTDESMAESSG
jgi:signal transduction histidine kinase/CheY-like chemotaxis protein